MTKCKNNNGKLADILAVIAIAIFVACPWAWCFEEFIRDVHTRMPLFYTVFAPFMLDLYPFLAGYWWLSRRYLNTAQGSLGNYARLTLAILIILPMCLQHHHWQSHYPERLVGDYIGRKADMGLMPNVPPFLQHTEERANLLFASGFRYFPLVLGLSPFLYFILCRRQKMQRRHNIYLALSIPGAAAMLLFATVIGGIGPGFSTLLITVAGLGIFFQTPLVFPIIVAFQIRLLVLKPKEGDVTVSNIRVAVNATFIVLAYIWIPLMNSMLSHSGL